MQAMRYQSTRNSGNGPTVGFDAAVAQGLAPDGGLYVPTRLPSFTVDDFEGVQDTVDIACRLLAPFVAGSVIAGELDEICRESFDFPLPVAPIIPDNRLSVLELFHGPTAAFKDGRFPAGARSSIIPDKQFMGAYNKHARLSRIESRIIDGNQNKARNGETANLLPTNRPPTCPETPKIQTLEKRVL